MGDRLQEYFPLLKLPRISTENTAPSLFNSPAHPGQVRTGAKNYMETTVRGNRWSNLRPEPEGRSRSGSECPPCGEIWAGPGRAPLPPHSRQGCGAATNNLVCYSGVRVNVKHSSYDFNLKINDCLKGSLASLVCLSSAQHGAVS